MSYDLGARPEAGEYGDFHAGYIAAVPEGDIRETLARESAAPDARATRPVHVVFG